MSIPGRMTLAATAAAAILVAACGGGATSPTSAPASAAAAPSAAGPAAATADPIAALKAKVNGKSIVFGVGSPPNLAEVTTRKTADYLKEIFGVTVDYKAVAADVEAAAVLAGSIHAGEVSFA